VISEWRAKADDLSAEIEASNKENRNYNSELFRLRAAHDEVVEQLDVVKRENKVSERSEDWSICSKFLGIYL
jgi:hypothetical protein